MENDRICVIFAGGPEEGHPYLPVPQQAYVICADSGLRLAQRLGIAPDLVLGDFDSLGAVPADLPHMTVPVEKDDTDTVLAARVAMEKGYRNIRIYGAFGGRLDHTLANIQTLEFLYQAGAHGELIGTHDTACLIGSGETTRFSYQPKQSLSLFSWTERCTGVCVRGVHYPLEQAVLERRFPLGVSNEITAPEAEIVCGNGILLAVRSAL